MTALLNSLRTDKKSLNFWLLFFNICYKCTWQEVAKEVLVCDTMYVPQFDCVFEYGFIARCPHRRHVGVPHLPVLCNRPQRYCYGNPHSLTHQLLHLAVAVFCRRHVVLVRREKITLPPPLLLKLNCICQRQSTYTCRRSARIKFLKILTDPNARKTHTLKTSMLFRKQMKIRKNVCKHGCILNKLNWGLLWLL